MNVSATAERGPLYLQVAGNKTEQTGFGKRVYLPAAEAGHVRLTLFSDKHTEDGEAEFQKQAISCFLLGRPPGLCLSFNVRISLMKLKVIFVHRRAERGIFFLRFILRLEL